MPVWPRRFRWILIPLVLGIAIAGLVTWLPSHSVAEPTQPAHGTKPANGVRADAAGKVRVAGLKPTTGGVPRKTTLPCEAHWYESADLFAKVSGYLANLEVDIGSVVKQGQVLATVDVPELERDVDFATATLMHAEAAVKQTEAKKKSAAAEQRAAEAACAKAESDVERWTAEQTFRQKEYLRFKELNKSDSVHAALVDEKLFQLQSVEAGRRAAETAILTAKEQAAAAAARVELAEADLLVARAQAKIATASLAKAKLMASFSKIVSPYDGVVTVRHFHRGEFVRAADKGGDVPLLTVARTNLIRVVVQIPDREVPYAHPGDAVKISFDALPGREFVAKLSRVSRSEDVSTRTMRAEADLPNNQNQLVDQMYGRMEIDLEPASDALTLPSACLVGDLNQGKSSVYVVRNGVARLQSIGVGADNGIQVEVVSGLSAADVVVIRPPAGLTEGTAVQVDLMETAPRS